MSQSATIDKIKTDVWHPRYACGLRRILCLSPLVTALLLLSETAYAADPLSSSPMSMIVLLGLLSLVPFVLVMITSFVKIAVVLSILRSAVGTPQIPPAIVINGLALILTAYVMAPTGYRVYEAVKPNLAANKTASGNLSLEQLITVVQEGKEPVRDFLSRHSRERDRQMFFKLAQNNVPPASQGSITASDFSIIVPAFAIGQLASAFQIGFLIFVPFLVIDLVVANILLALGMHMLSPTTISLPFKLLLFVLVDGWYLLAQGLIISYS